MKSLLASRPDAREADVGTVEDVDLIGLAAEECARVDADLDVSAVPEGLEVRGISKLLRRAIRNLLENARRYSTGEITVQVLRSGALAEVRVCDRGPGVPPARTHLRALLPPARRQRTLGRRGPGAGAGAIHRRAAQRQRALRRPRRWRCLFCAAPAAGADEIKPALRELSGPATASATPSPRTTRHPAPGPPQPPPAPG